MASQPSKTLTLGGQCMTVFGASAEDQYFQAVRDDLDPEFAQFIARNVAPDAMCMDVGANIGIKTVQLAWRAVQGKVVAVEAGPQAFAALQRTVAANGLTNVSTEHAAATTRDGGVVRFKENSAYGAILPEGAEVPAVTLGGVVTRHGLPRLDFVKIDVEGAEFSILRSSLALFARHGTVVLFEYNPWCILGFTEEHPRQCLQWLLATFPEVWALRRANPPETQVQRVLPSQIRDLLWWNMIEDGLVTDLAVCMAPGRIQA